MGSFRTFNSMILCLQAETQTKNKEIQSLMNEKKQLAEREQQQQVPSFPCFWCENSCRCQAEIQRLAAEKDAKEREMLMNKANLLKLSAQQV